MTKNFGTKPEWLISDNAWEYMLFIAVNILGDKEITHVPIVPHNSEENGIAERFNGTIMNTVRAALHTTKISWEFGLGRWPRRPTTTTNSHIAVLALLQIRLCLTLKRQISETCTFSDN